MPITLDNFEDAVAIKTVIDSITEIQNKNALSGSRVNLVVTNAAGTNILVDGAKIKSVIGDSAYNTICSTAFTSLGTELSTLKTTKEGEFDALAAEEA